MIDDPYKVLGLSPGASQDEIKRAYRRKAKENHPDYHPNDPGAEKRMHEINEAYDMLMHPDKYAQQRAQQQRQQQQQQYYGGYGQPFGGYSQQQSGGYGQQQQQYGQRGYGGWSSDFFGFDDFFGFGGAAGGSVQPPREQPGDTPQIQQVIRDINQRQYQAAIDRLQQIVSVQRNARWHYLSGVAHYGAGNTLTAAEHMQRAVQMDPNNGLYHTLLRQYRQAGQTYEQNARGYNMGAMDLNKICMGLCMLQLCCPYSRYLCCMPC